MEQDKAKLTLKDVKVVFFNPVDEGFGTTVTIDATDQAVRDSITTWVKENNIGKDTPGVPKFKEYQPDEGDKVIQYAFHINDNTRYGSTCGLTKDDIGWGARITITARAYEWDNKFGKGVSQSASAIVVLKGASTGGDEDLAELLADEGDAAAAADNTADKVPF